MGIKIELQTDLIEAFDGDLADAVFPFTISKDETATYDATNGIAIAGSVTSGSWRGIFNDNVKMIEIDGNETPIDAEVIAIASEAPFAPTLFSYITEGTTQYEILNIERDPTRTVYIMACQGARDG